MKKYKEEAAYLHETGGGVKTMESESDDWEVYTKMNFYIPATGSHKDTAPEHLNLWSMCFCLYIRCP